MTVQAAWVIACLYTFAYLLLLGYTCWLHKRVLRLEQFEWMRFPNRIKPESSTPCPGALCKAGRLPNGDLCGLCSPKPLPLHCPECQGFYKHSPACLYLQ